MSRKLLNEVDGFIVDEFQGTFTGTFDVRGADAKYLAYDDEVLVVVRARVKPPRLKELKNGDIVRVNVLQVKEGGVVRSDEMRHHLCEALGMDVVAPQLTLESALEDMADPVEPVEPTIIEPVPEEEEEEDDEEIFVPAGTGPSSIPDDFTGTDVQPSQSTGPSLKVQKFRADEASEDSVLAGFLGTS